MRNQIPTAAGNHLGAPTRLQHLRVTGTHLRSIQHGDRHCEAALCGLDVDYEQGFDKRGARPGDNLLGIGFPRQGDRLPT
jgi:hypothetical protein